MLREEPATIRVVSQINAPGRARQTFVCQYTINVRSRAAALLVKRKLEALMRELGQTWLDDAGEPIELSPSVPQRTPSLSGSE